MFRFAKWVRTMCSFQAVSDALLSTLSPANLTKYWHLQHVHRFCISLPPPSFAWVWHNGIPLLHRTCPRAKQAERSQALCHKLSQDACETCEKNVQKEDPLPLKLAFQHYKEHSLKKSHKKSSVYMSSRWLPLSVVQARPSHTLPSSSVQFPVS